jgi:hypothetical protein
VIDQSLVATLRTYLQLVTIYDAVESDYGLKPTVQQLGKKYFIAGQAMYVERNIEARSCKPLCRGKAISITYSECGVCVEP